MESGPGALPGFKCWRAAANSFCENLSEIFTAFGVVALQRSDTSSETSRDDLQSTASYFGRVSTHSNVQCESANRQRSFSGRGNARKVG